MRWSHCTDKKKKVLVSLRNLKVSQLINNSSVQFRTSVNLKATTVSLGALLYWLMTSYGHRPRRDYGRHNTYSNPGFFSISFTMDLGPFIRQTQATLGGLLCISIPILQGSVFQSDYTGCPELQNWVSRSSLSGLETYVLFTGALSTSHRWFCIL